MEARKGSGGVGGKDPSEHPRLPPSGLDHGEELLLSGDAPVGMPGEAAGFIELPGRRERRLPGQGLRSARGREASVILECLGSSMVIEDRAEGAALPDRSGSSIESGAVRAHEEPLLGCILQERGATRRRASGRLGARTGAHEGEKEQRAGMNPSMKVVLRRSSVHARKDGVTRRIRTRPGSALQGTSGISPGRAPPFGLSLPPGCVGPAVSRRRSRHPRNRRSRW